MPYIVVLARRVGAEARLQHRNRLMYEVSWFHELWWTLKSQSLMLWTLKSPPAMYAQMKSRLCLTFGFVTLPHRFRLGIIFGGEVWRFPKTRQRLALLIYYIAMYFFQFCFLVYFRWYIFSALWFFQWPCSKVSGSVYVWYVCLVSFQRVQSKFWEVLVTV